MTTTIELSNENIRTAMQIGMELLRTDGRNPERLVNVIERNYPHDPVRRLAVYAGAYMLAHSEWDPGTRKYAFGEEVRGVLAQKVRDKLPANFDAAGPFDVARIIAQSGGVKAVEAARTKNPKVAVLISMGAMSAAAAAGDRKKYCAYSVMFAQDWQTAIPTRKSAENLVAALREAGKEGLTGEGAEHAFRNALMVDPTAGDPMRRALGRVPETKSDPLALALSRAMSPSAVATRYRPQTDPVGASLHIYNQ